MDILSIFAERFKELTEDTNLTHEEIAKIAGCGHGSISRWKNGTCLPTLKNIIRVTAYFNCSIDFLLNRKETPEINSVALVSSFGERLKSSAKAKHKTLYAVSVDLTMNDVNIYRWANGQSEPNVYYLIMLANYFNCSVDYLIGRKD